MKIFATLALAAAAFTVSASAANYTVVVNCTSFNISSTPVGGNFGQQGTGSGTCSGVNLSGISNITAISGYVLFNNDFSSVQNVPITTSTLYTLSGFSGGLGATQTSDTLQATSPDAVNTTYTDSAAFGNQAAGLVNGVFVPFGTPDALTGVTTSSANTSFNVAYTNSMSQGSAGADTGFVKVVYTYTVTSGTPEPASMMLLGSGLIGLAMFGRKKLARK